MFLIFTSTLRLPLILEMQEFSLAWIDALLPGHNEKPTLITGDHGFQKFSCSSILPTILY